MRDRLDKSKLVPENIIDKWQRIINLIAEIVRIPAALIMRVEPPYLTVFIASESQGNPWKKGEKASLNTGLYCETVMARRDKLLIPDARKDKVWAHNPDIKLDMISYLGFPLIWPDDEIFGTICVLDLKENPYNALYVDLMRQFKENIEGDLRFIVEYGQLQERTGQIINHQTALLGLAKMDNSNLDTALKRITEVDSRTLGVDRVSVWLFNKDRSEIICENLYILSKNLHEKGLRLFAKEYPRYFQALKENRAMAADDARTDLRTNEFTEGYLKPLGITSMMDVPIRLHGKVVGIVGHEHTGQRKKWTLEEQEFAASIADIVSLAWETSKRRQVEEKLKESEKNYRDLVEAVPVGIYKTNLKGDILFANKSLAELFEFESPEEVMRHSILEIYKNPKDRERLIKNFQRAGKVNNFEFEVVTSTGKTKNISLNAVLDKDIMLGIIMDITERTKLKNDLREKMIELKEFYDMAINRELKMIELKKDIKRLKEELERYKA